MRKNQRITVSSAWVKNVYSLRMDSRIVSGNTLISYTPPTLLLKGYSVQTTAFTQLPMYLSSVLSTLKNTVLPQLIDHLYPVSTAPTMKKKKEIKERNS